MLNTTIRKRRGPIFRFGTGAVMIGMALAGCTTGGTASGSSVASGAPATDTVRTTLSADPTTFSPLNSRSKDDYTLARYLFDTLVRRDEGGKVVGGLASKWEVSPTAGIFTIRKDATCSDGTPITPSVVTASLTAFSDKKTGSQLATMVFGPKGASFTADDAAGTVRIDLNQAWSDMIIGLTHSLAGVVCPAGLADPQALAKGTVPGAYSGPYVLKGAEHGVKYSLELREGYTAWPQFTSPLAGKAPKKVELSVVGNDSTIANQLLTNGLDVAALGGRDAERLNNNNDFEVQKAPTANFFVLFNERTSSPFNDETARKAVASTLDAKAFNQAVSGGGADVLASVVSPGVQCAVTDRSKVIQPDPAAAKALAGVKIRVASSNLMGPNGAAGSYVADKLRAAGADVTLQNTDNGTWATTLTTKPDAWDVAVMGDLNVLRTLSSSLVRLSGPTQEEGGLNIGGIVNETAVAKLTEGMSTTDGTARCAALEVAQQSLIDHADVIPMSNQVISVVSRNGFSVRVYDGVVDDATVRLGQ
jgi:peptide/nickel transport system substrate-binding protein